MCVYIYTCKCAYMLMICVPFSLVRTRRNSSPVPVSLASPNFANRVVARPNLRVPTVRRLPQCLLPAITRDPICHACSMHGAWPHLPR